MKYDNDKIKAETKNCTCMQNYYKFIPPVKSWGLVTCNILIDYPLWFKLLMVHSI